MTTRSGSQTVTFVSATPEPVGNATSEPRAKFAAASRTDLAVQLDIQFLTR